MGLFNFVKEVGEKIFGNSDEPKVENIQEAVASFDLGGVEGIEFAIEGDKVILSGEAASSEALEKAILAAGNTQGIAQVESNVQVASATAEPVFYTVKKGDYLSKISKELYGDANRYNEIFEANKPMLSHPDKIYPGQVLRIPGATNIAQVA